MDFFDELNRSVSGVSRVGGLKNLIHEEEQRINALYVEIGTLYFESNKNNSGALYSAQITGIKDALARIDGYNRQICMTRGGAPAGPVCSKCGNPMSAADQFCAICGTRAGYVQPKGVPCVKCGAMLSEGSAFCAICGAKQEPPKEDAAVTCKNCGTTLDINSAFCMICGTKVEVAEQATPAEQESAAEESAVQEFAEETLQEAIPEEPVTEEAAQEVISAEEVISVPETSVVLEETPEESIETPVVEVPLETETEVVAEEVAEEPVWTPIEVSEEEVSQEIEPVAEETVAQETAVQETVTSPAEEIMEEVIPAEPVAEETTESEFEITVEECAEEAQPGAESIPEAVLQPEDPADQIIAQNPYAQIAGENICKVCGKEVAPTAKFCIYCGTKR